MSEPLASRYRPARFQDMVGQHLTSVVLSTMVSTQRVPSALMFSGPSGTGKTTAARILASTLDPTADPALSIIEIDAASNGGVADIRSLTESMRYSSGGKWRVVILDEAHSLTRDAFNALLKTLEEPPPGTVFVLVTTEPNKIPETVASRLMEFEFRRVSPAEIFDRLVVISHAEQMSVGVDLLQRLASDADGSVRRAIMDLEKADLAGLHTVEAWLEAVAVTDCAPGILAALAHGRVDSAFESLEQALASVGHPSVVVAQITACLRDLLVLRAGGTLILSGDPLQTRKALALRLEPERIVAAIKICWDLKTRIRPTDDPRGSLDLAVALIGEVFMRGRTPVSTPVAPPAAPVSPVPTPAAPVTQPPPRRLSLSELTLS